MFSGTGPSSLWFRCSHSNPALGLVLRVATTVHSGKMGPVHTGIVSGIELFGVPRLQRGLGSSRLPLRRALCFLRFVIVYMFRVRGVVSYLFRGRLDALQLLK